MTYWQECWLASGHIYWNTHKCVHCVTISTQNISHAFYIQHFVSADSQKFSLLLVLSLFGLLWSLNLRCLSGQGTRYYSIFLFHLWTTHGMSLFGAIKLACGLHFLSKHFEIPLALCSVLPPTNPTYGKWKGSETDKRLTYLITLLWGQEMSEIRQ